MGACPIVMPLSSWLQRISRISHEVDHALEIRFGAHGQLQRHGHRAELRLHLLQHAVEVRPDPVQLVDVGDAGNVVAVRLVPDRFRLRLHSAHGAENGHRAVQHAQGALHLGGEIHVPRGVDDVDLVVAPVAGGCGRGDGDAPLLLLVHPVHGGFAVVHFAHAMGLAREEQDSLGRRGFPRVDVRDDPDVAYAVEICHAFLREKILERARSSLYRILIRREKAARDASPLPSPLPALRRCPPRQDARFPG